MKYFFWSVIFVSGIVFGQEFYKAEDLKPGSKGYALTVFQGTEPEKIDLEIIDYIPNRMAKAGLILVKLSGEKIERTRVAAGMSGSPVYVDGKLVGALAYTWANARELMAGVVPIQDMLSDKTRGTAIPINGNNNSINPIKSAWSLTGLDDPELLQAVQNIDNTSVSGVELNIPVKSSSSNGNIPLKPGDSVAIKLIDGDINLASIGTVTYVNGEDVYIYGHPMEQWGPITLPLAKAKIYDIIASTELSFKLGAAQETVGATVFDGLSSVYGRFDRYAPMTPVSISFRNSYYTNIYNISIAQSQKYLPVLLSQGIGSILNRELGTNIEKRIKLSWNMEFTNKKSVTNNVLWVKNTIYDPASIKGFWKDYTSILWNNPIIHLVPEKITLTVDIEDKPYSHYYAHNSKLNRYDFLPGDTIHIRTALSEPQGNTFFTNMSFKLPQNLKSGQYTILIGSGIAIGTEINNTFLESQTIKTEQKLIQELEKPILTEEFKIVLIDTQNASSIGNNILENIPISRRSLFNNINTKGSELNSPKLTEQSIFFDKPILGIDAAVINIIEASPLNVP